jgi:hypothetical protein
VNLPPFIAMLTAAFLLLGCSRESSRSAHSVCADVADADAAPLLASASSVTVEADASAEAAPPAEPSVVLHWRETARRVTHDVWGNEHWTVELELVVQGGTPSRVRLGRRHAYGFTLTQPYPGDVAFVQSYLDAHGEYATVTRAGPGRLRVEAYGQDEALPDHVPPRTNSRTAFVRIPVDAGVAVDEIVEEPDGG